MLSIAALLRRGVTVDRGDRVELLGLGLAMEAVLEVSPADRRRRVCAKRQRAAAPILERVHLLLNHVRAGARGAREELGLLEERRLDPAVAVERAEALDLTRDALPE